MRSHPRRPSPFNAASALRAVRGVASVEVVIVLPVFVLLFVGLSFIGKLALARADVDAEARRCAWLYAMNDCQELPEGCAPPTSSPVAGGDSLGDAVSHGKGVLGREQGRASGAIAQFIGSVFGKALSDVAGCSPVANASRTVSRSPLFGGKINPFTGSYGLACNLEPQTVGSIAEQAWKALEP
jgi:hypothetical protein